MMIIIICSIIIYIASIFLCRLGTLMIFTYKWKDYSRSRLSGHSMLRCFIPILNTIMGIIYIVSGLTIKYGLPYKTSITDKFWNVKKENKNNEQ